MVELSVWDILKSPVVTEKTVLLKEDSSEENTDRKAGQVLTFRVDREYRLFVQILDDVPEAKHHDLMRDDEHALAGVMQTDRIERAAEPKDDVAPALARRRTIVELPEPCPMIRLLGIKLLDPDPRQPIERAELFFAQALIHDHIGFIVREPAGGEDCRAGLPRAQVGRAQYDLWFLRIG